MILRTVFAVLLGLGIVTSASANQLEWRDSVRKLAFDETTSMTLEYFIIDLPNGDQFRLTCQGVGTKKPVFQVVFQESDAQKSSLTMDLTENGTDTRLRLGPLVYRSLEGIRRAVPEGLLDRIVAAEQMRFTINNGLHWHEVSPQSTEAVLPRLSCYKNN